MFGFFVFCVSSLRSVSLRKIRLLWSFALQNSYVAIIVLFCRKLIVSAQIRTGYALKFLHAHKNSPYGLRPSRLILFAIRTHFVPSVRNFKKKSHSLSGLFLHPNGLFCVYYLGVYMCSGLLLMFRLVY